jgi:hypothetical protein
LLWLFWGVGCWRFNVSNGYEVVNGYQLHSS